MGIEENKAAIQRLVDDVFNGGDLSLIPELVSPNLVVHVIPEYRGHDGLRQHMLETGESFTDVRIVINHIFAEGDMVASRWTASGTHKGELFGIPPTGKKATWKGISIYRFADGKIVEAWWSKDMFGLMQQLGVIPMPEQD